MLGTIINVVLVLAGSILGLIFKNRISTRFASGLNYALGLCVLGIGISSMIKTNDTLCVIVCMVVGTLAGEALNIERRMEMAGRADTVLLSGETAVESGRVVLENRGRYVSRGPAQFWR